MMRVHDDILLKRVFERLNTRQNAIGARNRRCTALEARHIAAHNVEEESFGYIISVVTRSNFVGCKRRRCVVESVASIIVRT